MAGWRQAARRLYKVLIVVVLADLSDRFVRHLMPAFLRSMVRCSTPAAGVGGEQRHKHAGHLPQVHSCTGVMKFQHTWSGSKHCSRRAIVVNTEVRMAGRIAVAHRIGFLAFPMIFVGPLLDIWGRKPVLQLAVAGSLAELSCYLGAAYTYSDGGLGSESQWLLSAGFFTGTTDALDPAATAMVADLSAPTAVGRSAALSLFMVTRHISHTLGILGSSQLMRLHLGDYNLVWVGTLIFTTGLLIVASFILPNTHACLHETVSEDESNSNGCREEVNSAVSHRPTCGSCSPVCRPICTKFAEAFRFIWLDRFLLNFLLLRFTLTAGGAIAHAVVEPFLVGHLGYPMHIAALGAGIFPCTMALGSGLYWLLAPRCGPFAMYGGGILTVGLGFGLCGLAGPCSRFADAAFWGGLVFAALGNGMIDPTTYVITSLRADPCTVGVVFTLLHVLGTFGSIVGQLLTTQILFDAQAQGWVASLPLFISSATMFLSLAWFGGAYRWSRAAFVSDENNCDAADPPPASCSQELPHA